MEAAPAVARPEDARHEKAAELNLAEGGELEKRGKPVAALEAAADRWMR